VGTNSILHLVNRRFTLRVYMKLLGKLSSGLKSTIVLRVIITTILLGSGAVVYYLRGARTEAFYLVVILALVYFLSLIYLLVQSVLKSYPRFFQVTQLTLDIALASTAIYITGGRSSPFIFLYVLIIIYASIVLSRLASYVTALVSGVIYILIVYYQTRLHFPLDSEVTLGVNSVWGEGGLVSTYFHLTGFLLIAILGGYLSDRLRLTGRELGESKKTLRVLKNLHENILESLTSGLLTLDLQGKIISVNKTGRDILGKGDGSHLLGSDLSSLISGLQIRNFSSSQREQISYSRPDGRTLTLGFSSSDLRDTEQELQGYIIIFQDLTEVKELEERLMTSEKMAVLGQLSAGLAHELRNPLSAISGAVEILKEDMTPSDEHERLIGVATQEVERLNLLVEDFLILTMPMQKNQSSVDLGKIVSDTVDSFTKTIRRSNIEIVNGIEEGIYVRAHSYRLKQAVWNLLMNSIDAMPAGGRVALSSELKDGKVILKFSDDGRGIEDKIKSRLFDPFFTTKEVGTGLGLAIVQKVIEGYNGKVDVVSSPGKGTTFIITLPRIH
jgi:two-component system, NtrC family, sensor histidine kinase PilS